MSNTRPTPPTIEAIAALAGVSVGTVSRVLTGRLDYRRRGARERALRIRQLAAETGYRPNAAARAIVTGRFHTVTAVISADRTFRGTLNPHLLLGLTIALEEQRLHLSVTAAHDQQLEDPAYVPHTLGEHCADGLLVIVNIGVSTHMARLIADTRLPVVWVNDKRDHDAVYPDDYAAGRQAAELLLSAGHKRLTYVDYTTTPEDAAQLHYSRRDRAAGFTAAARAAGIEPLPLPPAVATWSFEQQYHGWRDWLRQPDRPTAVAAYSVDKLAPFFAALASLDWRPPHDVSVVVFADELVLGPYPLTTLIVPHAMVGRQAVALLRRRIENPGQSQPSIIVPFTTTPNLSIAEPKRS